MASQPRRALRLAHVRAGVGAVARVGERPDMRIRGVVRTAELQEHPPGSDRVEMALRVQGVGPGQPRLIVVPFPLLVADPSLDPDAVAGRGFEAEVSEDDAGRWVVETIALASRVLRPPG